MSIDESPVLGRHSPAAEAEPRLRVSGEAADACYRIEAASTDRLALRAASITGIRHRLAGQAGEDSFAWSVSGPRLAVAVADGLGAVPGSQAAARRAVLAGSEVAAARGSVGPAMAAANDAAAGGGATTLVVALVDSDGTVEAARVGDSTAFWVTDRGETWRELFEPAGGAEDQVGTETDALPSPAVEWETVRLRLDRSDVLVLATDGVADPWRDGPNTVAPALARALAAHPGPLELARLVDFSRQGCHDDRTVVSVWIRGTE
ncbi:MAG TPA: protein phosphatase 2C domain-containing protein [Acidimicrobiales bacterium]|nr:protein phosphatase 2C domain-containing protein [Acidimicrobiales bacterium]